MDRKIYEKIGEINWEKIIKWIKCKSCSNDFAIFDKDLEFYNKISPSFEWIKYNIPTPTKCPSCRILEAASFINDNVLYKRKSDMSGRSMIWAYSEDKDIIVYSHDEWFSDKWDPMSYWIDFDFNKWFFEQINNLFQKLPKINYKSFDSENSDYSFWLNMKNCYLVMIWVSSENCCYSERIMDSKDCIDCSDLKNSSLCYESIWSNNCYNCFYIENWDNNQNCFFSTNLINCKNCIFCNNLSNKEYFIENKSYTKQEYEKIYSDLISKIWNQKELNLLIEKYNNLIDNSIRKSLNIINSEKSLWYNLANCNNVNFVNFWNNSQNCRYSRMNNNGIDCYDTDAYQSNFCYQVHYGKDTYNSLLSFPYFENNKNIIYSMYCQNCENLFWCIGLRDKKYCIFNKQYDKIQYEKLVSKIIQKMIQDKEWWEYFPISMSPFGYNETPAYEINQLKENEATTRGFSRQSKDFPINIPDNIETIKAQDLPDNIKDIDDSILNKAILCEITGKPFRIIKMELDFYRKFNIRLPRKHYSQRHLERLKKRHLWVELYLRECDKCWDEIITQYNQWVKFKIYCEECYKNI